MRIASAEGGGGLARMPVGSQDDLEAVIASRFHARRVEALRPLITAEMVEEHWRSPLGPHSDGLQRVLNYLGLFGIDGKLITEHDGEAWFVCRVVGFPALRAERVAGPLDSEAQALHEVFRRRLLDVFGVRFP
jgi:branched-chain amino acid transport system permease protein